MIVKPAGTTPSLGTENTASTADGRSCGSRPTARIKIPTDRLPAAPEPTLPIRAWEKVDTFAGIEHDYRVRKAVKKEERQKGAGEMTPDEAIVMIKHYMAASVCTNHKEETGIFEVIKWLEGLIDDRK